MKKIIIKPRKVAISPKKLDAYQRGYLAARRSSSNEEESNCGCLCMFLGGFFGPIGLIVAAIIGKAEGVKSALLGWFLGWLVLLLIFIIVGLAIAAK